MEVWLPIIGWEGFYEVSNLGNVRSVDRVVSYLCAGRPVNRKIAGQPMKTVPDGDGYRILALQRDSRAHTVYVHAIVLETFIGPCPEGMQCRHLNGNKTDNRLENLQWGTPLQNAEDRDRHGTHSRGEKHHKARLSDAEVSDLRRAHSEEGLSYRVLGERFGCSAVHARRIVVGRSRKV
jgi:hypothetical protein